MNDLLAEDCFLGCYLATRLNFQILPLPRGFGLNVVGGMGSGEGEGGLFPRLRLVYILILSLLLSLKSLEKFVWWWWVVVSGGV